MDTIHMSPLTMNAFSDALKKSGLMTDQAFQARIAELESSEIDLNDSKATARAFINAGDVTSWQAEKLLAGKHKGFFLGKYKLLRLLGRGGMSAVYLAEHSVMKRRCAIKVLPANRVDDSSYLGRFHLEAQAAAALDDPHIVRAYDVDQFSDGKSVVHFLVMEYVEGRDLHQVIMREGPLTPIDAAEYVRQAAMGLHHAHECGLVHRDIKPGNLLLDLKGTVKILDMGLARFFDESDDNSLTIQHDERVLGTADFLSPEQAINSHNVDHRADIYSLGCTLYFMLTKHAPFEQGSLAQRLMAHQTQEPPSVTKYRQDVPESLLVILNKMMAKKPEDRHENAEAVAQDLKNWIVNHADQQWLNDHERQWDSRPHTNAKPAAADSSNINVPAEVAPTTDEFGDFLTMIGSEEPGSGLKPGSGSGMLSGFPGRKSGVQKKQTSENGSSVNPAEMPVETGSTPKSSGHVAKTRNSSKVTKSNSSLIKRESSIKRKSRSTLPASIQTLLDQAKEKPALYGGIAAAILALIFVPMYLFSGGDKNKEPEQANVPTKKDTTEPEDSVPEMTEEVPIVGVNMTIGEGETFNTLSEAIEYLKKYNDPLSFQDERKIILKPGVEYSGTIEILEPTFRFPKKLRIVCESDSKVVWKGDGTQPLLRLDSVEGLVLENIEFDAAGAPVVIEVQGACPGTTIRNSRVINFNQTGIDLAGTAGLFTTVVKVENCSFNTSNASAKGIVIRPGDATSESLQLLRCQFEGPFATGIEIQSDFVRWLDIKECKFQKLERGIFIDPDKPTLVSLAIGNNTFHQCDQAIVMRSVPSETSEDMIITRNLFIESQQADFSVLNGGDANGLTASLRANPAGASFNWTTRSKPETDNSPTIFAENARFDVKDITLKNTDPAQGDYLKPDQGKGRVAGESGFKPYVGAVSP